MNNSSQHDDTIDFTSQPVVKNLLLGAIDQVPFYSDIALSEHHDDLLQRDSRSLLAQMPVITKADYQSNWESFLARERFEQAQGDIRTDYTSGSTGAPLRCIRTKMELIAAERNVWRYRNAWGIAATARHTSLVARFGHTSLGRLEPSEPIVKNSGRHSKIEFDIDAPPEPEAIRVRKVLQQNSPEILLGGMSYLRLFADLILEGKVEPLGSQLKIVESIAEFLDPRDRERMSEAFGCPVVNIYGSRETHVIAYDCPNLNLHVVTDNVIIESIQPENEQLEPETVVTSLVFKTMPFIRYNLGDFVSIDLEPCSCGWSSPLLQIVHGRKADMVAGHPAVSGSFLFGALMTRFYRAGFRGIKQFQVVQNAVDRFTLFVVAEPEFDMALLDRYVEYVKSSLGNVVLESRIVSRIPIATSGKTPIFVGLNRSE
jgi:phenylacetate-CoA ligase